MTTRGLGSRKGPPATSEAGGLRMVGYHDMADRPAFKLAMQEHSGRWYLYTGHFWDSGWSVVDVTDPTNPQLMGLVKGPHQTWTLQVQAADGLLVTALEKAAPGWGFIPEQTEKTGIFIWDIASDPAQPNQLSHFDIGGRGTHRNHYAGGSYAYLAAQPEGYEGNILVVVDVEDPSQPREVSRWWWPGQWIDGGEKPDHLKYFHGPAYISGEFAYLGYGQVGAVVLNIADPTSPHLLSRVSFGDFGASIGCHTVIPYGEGIAVANSEAIAERGEEHLNFAVTLDISDPKSPKISGWLPIPEPSWTTGFDTYLEKAGRFGPHNQHHYQGQACLLDDPDHVYMTYFNAGLRIYDISKPVAPKEVAYFVPGDPVQRLGVKPETGLVTQFEDVLVDSRGFIYCSDKNHGIFILERK